MRESPEDLMMVKNIDLNCSEVTSEIVRKDVSREDENGHRYVAYEEVVEEFSHADYFQVKFNGYPHRIAPGETKVWPRYLAEHYAKHLADHMLQKQEASENKMGLVNSKVERPKVLKQIIVGVQQYYYDSEEANMTAEQQRIRQIEDLNRPAAPGLREEGGRKVHDLGEVEDRTPVVNKALGVLEDEPKSLEEVLADVPDDKPTVERDPNKPALTQPNAITRKELFEAAHAQGIKVTGRETKDQLVGILQKYV